MSTITIQEAQAQLPALIENLQAGQELVITRDDRPVAKLIGQQQSLPPRRLGTLKGTILHMAPDFDAPLEEFKEYMR